MSLRGFAIALICTFAGCVAASAQPVSHWRDAVAGDVRAGEDYRLFRIHDARLFLSAVGDFDGDGRQDVVRLRVNSGARLYAVVVTDSHGQHQIETGPLADLPRVGVHAVPKGRLTSQCYEEGEACPQHYLELSTEAFDVATFEANDTVFFACPAVNRADTGYCPFGLTD